jgi:hypothetical protein
MIIAPFSSSGLSLLKARRISHDLLGWLRNVAA